MLASALKVPSRKLELLESDRHEALPGLAFVRGLALAVCRYLEADAQPVLALLPLTPGAHNELEHVTRGLAAPFREPGGHHESRSNLSHWLRLPLLLPLGLLIAAALFWYLPDVRRLGSGWALHLPSWSSPDAPSPGTSTAPVATGSVTAPVDAASGASAATSDAAVAQGAAAALPASAVIETVFSAPPVDPNASVPAPAAAAGSLVLRTTAASWVEVSDGANRVQLARMLTPGETVGLDGSLPMKVKIGNAAGTEVTFRGKRIDLAPLTRENVARLELK
jgi:cytoskeleton protein RodZ